MYEALNKYLLSREWLWASGNVYYGLGCNYVDMYHLIFDYSLIVPEFSYHYFKKETIASIIKEND
jgi:hypothetical protein